jgi:hypothetical protein
MKHDMQHTKQPAAANTGMNMMNVEKSAPAILATVVGVICCYYSTAQAQIESMKRKREYTNC